MNEGPNDNEEPIITVMTKDFIRDEISSVISATPTRYPCNAMSFGTENPDEQLVGRHKTVRNIKWYKMNIIAVT